MQEQWIEIYEFSKKRGEICFKTEEKFWWNFACWEICFWLSRISKQLKEGCHFIEKICEKKEEKMVKLKKLLQF